MFTEAVNAAGGYVKFPWPYEGYIVIEYDLTVIPEDPSIENGLWDFSLEFIRNPYADRIANAFGKQSIDEKKLIAEESNLKKI